MALLWSWSMSAEISFIQNLFPIIRTVNRWPMFRRPHPGHIYIYIYYDRQRTYEFHGWRWPNVDKSAESCRKDPLLFSKFSPFLTLLNILYPNKDHGRNMVGQAIVAIHTASHIATINFISWQGGDEAVFYETYFYVYVYVHVYVYKYKITLQIHTE